MLTSSTVLDPEPVNQFQAAGPSCAVAWWLSQTRGRLTLWAVVRLRFLTSSEVPARARICRWRQTNPPICEWLLFQGMKLNTAVFRWNQSFFLLGTSFFSAAWLRNSSGAPSRDPEHLRAACSRSGLCFPLRSQPAHLRNFPVAVIWFSERHLSDFRGERFQGKPSSILLETMRSSSVLAPPTRSRTWKKTRWCLWSLTAALLKSRTLPRSTWRFH